MVLIQLTVSLDDLLNNGAFPNGGTTIQPITANTASYNNPGTVLKQVNLYGGRYHCKIAGFDVYSGAMNVTTYEMAPQILHISSSKFLLPANGTKSLSFTNNGYNSLPLYACREFVIDAISGQIDLTVQITQFGQAINNNPQAIVAPYTVDKTATWTSAQFSYIILSLEVTELEKKEIYGNK